MSITDYEKRLQECNPKLHIKRYGSSMAAIHLGNLFICRVPQGEIVQNNCFEWRDGEADQYKTNFNPTGKYKFKLMTRRGRAEAARIMYTQRVIKYTDIPKLS